MGYGKLRNQPCQCGSGKKYKKCCQPTVLHFILVQQDSTPELKKAGQKTAKYWRNKYRRLIDGQAVKQDSPKA